MVRTPTAETRGSAAYQRLRSALLDGEYGPGARLVTADLAKRFSETPGIMREALGQLAQEDLVVPEPNRGYRVIPVGESRIRELVELRSISEQAAVRLAVERGDRSWEGEVLAAHHRLVSSNDEDTRGATHRDFHMAVLSGCGNSRLLATCASLSTEAELYRRWAQLELGRTGATSTRAASREHRAIVDAVLQRDADAAANLIDAHLRTTESLALEYVRRLRVTSQA